MDANALFQHDRSGVLINIEHEQRYWEGRAETLPKIASVRGFSGYWRLIARVYDTYLNHPHCDRATAFAFYMNSVEVREQGLSAAHAQGLFSLVMDRICNVRTSHRQDAFA